MRLSRFTRRFDDVTVIDGLELAIQPGEFVALIGRSGSGKTMLLRNAQGGAALPIHAMGALSRGLNWEMVAVPDIRLQAQRLADQPAPVRQAVAA